MEGDRWSQVTGALGESTPCIRMSAPVNTLASCVILETTEMMSVRGLLSLRLFAPNRGEERAAMSVLWQM